MARELLSIGGALIGGPIGFAIGSLIGNAIDPVTIKGPKLGDLPVQTSRDGGPRGIPYGTIACHGNVIDRGEFVKKKKKQRQGKGGPVTVTEHVYLTFAVGICEGPIAAVLRIWEDEKLVYDARTGSGFSQETTKYAQGIEIYLGDESQLPDPDLETIHGVGTTPAYRGTAYVVFRNKDLTERRGSIPQFRFEVTSALASTTDPYTVALLHMNGTNGSSSFPDDTARSWTVEDATVTTAQSQFGGASGQFTAASTCRIYNSTPNADFAFGSGDWTAEAWVRPTTIGGGTNGRRFILGSDASGTTCGFRLAIDSAGKLLFVDANDFQSFAGTTTMVTNTWYHVAVSCASGTVRTYVNGTLQGSITKASDVSASWPFYIGGRYNNGESFDGQIDEVRVSKGIARYTSAFTPSGPFALEEDSVTGDTVALSAIVDDICDRNGIDSAEIDVSELTDLVTGFLVAGEFSGADVIRSLQRGYFFDAPDYDGKIYFTKRGAASVASIPEDDLLEELEDGTRQQEVEFPRKIHLNYQSPDYSYTPTKQTAQRISPDVRVVGEATVEIPVNLTATQAAQMADKMLKVAWMDALGEYRLKVPDSYAYLTPADCVNVTWRSKTRRMRIEKIEFSDGVMFLTCRYDRISAYASSVTGTAPRDPLDNPSTFPGDTTFEFMDLPAMADSEDSLGYYTAIAGASNGWTGARVQRSTDAGATFNDLVDDTVSAVVGQLTVELPYASPFVKDNVNTLSVNLITPDAVLEDCTEAQLLQRYNAMLIGDEIAQFQDVTDNGSGDWDCVTLLRGRLNTTPETWPVGTRVVLLDSVLFAPAQTSMIDQDLTHRAVSYGNPADEAAEQTDTWTARCQTEWAPEYLELARDGGDVITATWIPRHRFGTAINPVASVHFLGWRVTLDDGVLDPVTFDVTTAEFSYDASALGTPLDVTVAGINRYTGAGDTATGSV